MDSTETPDLEDQTSAGFDQENTQQIEINGEMVDIEELKKGYLRQSDYTRKAQELAKAKAELERKPQGDLSEEELADQFIAQKGYVKKSDLQAEIEARLSKERESSKLDRIIDLNPSLKQHETAIRKIAEVDNSAIEDIIVKYNFLSSDKLSKAKQRDVVGSGKGEEKPLDIASMTPEQFTAWKAKNGIGSSTNFTRGRSI